MYIYHLDALALDVNWFCLNSTIRKVNGAGNFENNDNKMSMQFIRLDRGDIDLLCNKVCKNCT